MKMNLKESENIEFKSSISELDDIGKTIVAFANTKGGDIYIGVKDNGDILKISIEDSSFKKISSLNQSFEPKLTNNFSIQEVKINGLNILKITVKKSDNNCHSFKNVCYIRLGTTNQKLLPSDIAKRYNSLIKHDWTGEFVRNTSFNDLDDKAVSFLRDKMFLKTRDETWKSDHAEKILKRFHLCNDNGNLTKAALLFLGKYEVVTKHLHVDICQISWRYVDEKNKIEERVADPFNVPFILALDPILHLINRFNTTIKDIDLFRDDVKQYDIKAVEEVFINSLAHRDWGINLWNEIIQTPTYLEIRNPGSFNANIRDVLLKNNTPEYRNPSLCNFFNKLGLMERERAGLQKVFNTQLRKGLRVEFNFLNERTDFILEGIIKNEDFAKMILKNTSISLEELLILEKISIGKNILGQDFSNEDFELVKKYVKKAHNSSLVKIDYKLLSNLEILDKQFLEYHTSGKTKEEVFSDFARKNGFITTKNAYILFPKDSKNTIRSILKSMKDSGFLISSEPGKFFLNSKK